MTAFLTSCMCGPEPRRPMPMLCFDLHDSGVSRAMPTRGCCYFTPRDRPCFCTPLATRAAKRISLSLFTAGGVGLDRHAEFLSAPHAAARMPGRRGWFTSALRAAYAGGRTLNIAQITNAFLRAKVSGTFSGTMTVDVNPVIAVSQQYSATGTVFSATTQIHPGWHGTNIYASGGGHPFFPRRRPEHQLVELQLPAREVEKQSPAIC